MVCDIGKLRATVACSHFIPETQQFRILTRVSVDSYTDHNSTTQMMENDMGNIIRS